MRPPDAGEHGFTLVEILIAVFLSAFAVVGLISFFSLSQRISREGEEEARAALIAENILNTLTLNPRSGSFSLATATSEGTLHFESIDPRKTSNRSVVYGAACEPLFAMDPEKTDSPVSTPEALAVATVRLEKKSSLPGLVQADIEIGSPAAAPSSGRSIQRFVRLLPMPPTHD